MISDFLKKNIKSQANFVEYGYGQVEPNHLSAQRTGQIYAQLPAAADIDVLENGQFVKYDYATETVNFGSEDRVTGEWMLVYNEIKLYREHQLDCEFAMVKDNYNARIYSPMDGVEGTSWEAQSRYYNGIERTDENGNVIGEDGVVEYNTTGVGKSIKHTFEKVTAKPDMYELHYNEDPFHIESRYVAKKMPEGTKMVPRVFKTNVGDIFTTNTINVAEGAELKVGDTLKVGATGILEAGSDDKMTWQVVKIYTMPDRQKGVKIMRIV